MNSSTAATTPCTGAESSHRKSPSKCNYLTGKLKHCCQDFRVNEIIFFRETFNSQNQYLWSYYDSKKQQRVATGCCGTSPIRMVAGGIAPTPNVTPTDKSVARDSSSSTGTCEHLLKKKNDTESITTEIVTEEQNDEEEEEIEMTNIDDAKKRLEEILISLFELNKNNNNSFRLEEEKLDAILSQLDQLQNKAVQIIQKLAADESSNNNNILSEIEGEEFSQTRLPCLPKNTSSTKRKLLVRQFHQLVRHWYPFVTADFVTCTEREDIAEAVMQLKINNIFFEFAPFLQEPVDTLLQFYRVRYFLCDNTTSQQQQQQVILALKNSTKESRRFLHTKISSLCRNTMKTTTTSTSTIVVTNMNRRGKKRKRHDTKKQPPQDSSVVLCTVKKTGVEHFTCIHTLANMIPCSISDIGSAVSEFGILILIYYCILPSAYFNTCESILLL